MPVNLNAEARRQLALFYIYVAFEWLLICIFRSQRENHAYTHTHARPLWTYCILDEIAYEITFLFLRLGHTNAVVVVFFSATFVCEFGSW